MNIITILIFTWLLLAFINLGQQKVRIQLLAKYLAHYRIEHLMREINEGYMRALGEESPERQNQIWTILHGSEQILSEQFEQFSRDFALADESATKSSLISVAIPFAEKLFPTWTFDMRKLVQIHAASLRRAVHAGDKVSPKDRARNILAELYLIQHSCHWFCKSKNIASARLFAQHQTAYDDLLKSLTNETRIPYKRLMYPQSHLD